MEYVQRGTHHLKHSTTILALLSFHNSLLVMSYGFDSRGLNIRDCHYCILRDSPAAPLISPLSQSCAKLLKSRHGSLFSSPGLAVDLLPISLSESTLTQYPCPLYPHYLFLFLTCQICSEFLSLLMYGFNMIKFLIK